MEFHIKNFNGRRQKKTQLLTTRPLVARSLLMLDLLCLYVSTANHTLKYICKSRLPYGKHMSPSPVS